MLSLEIAVGPGEFSQLQDQGILRLEAAERLRVGAQRRREDQSVTTVVLGAGHREAVAEPIELLRVDREDSKAVLQQGIDQHAVRRLDRNRHRTRLALAKLHQPRDQGRNPLATVLEAVLLRPAIDQRAHLVLPVPPVDSNEDPERQLFHTTSSGPGPKPLHSYTGARGATPYWCSLRTPRRGASPS